MRAYTAAIRHGRPVSLRALPNFYDTSSRRISVFYRNQQPRGDNDLFLYCKRCFKSSLFLFFIFRKTLYFTSSITNIMIKNKWLFKKDVLFYKSCTLLTHFIHFSYYGFTSANLSRFYKYQLLMRPIAVVMGV